MTKSKTFLYILLCLILGVVGGSFFDLPLFLAEILILLAVSAAIVFRKNKKILLGSLFLLMAVIGWLRIDWVKKEKPDLAGISNQSVVFKAVVADDPVIKNNYLRFEAKVYYINEEKIKYPFSVLVMAKKFPEYKLGDDLSLQGKIEEPQSSDNFDYKAYLAGQKIFALSYFPAIEKTSEGRVGIIKKSLVSLRKNFERKIELVLPEPHSSFLKGLLLGEKGSLPTELIDSFKKTGTSHLIALSGYNITIVGRFFIAIFSLLLIPFSISFWLAALGILSFVLMTGAEASVVRAAIMGILVLVARREGRTYHMTNALVLAGALMVWQNPLILRFDVGFQLSFLATLGLVFLAPVLEEWFQKIFWNFRKLFFLKENKIIRQFAKQDDTGKMFLSFRKILTETISAQIMVLPILILVFGQVSLISPVVNLLVLPAVPSSMGLGFLTGMLGFIFYPLSQFFGWISWLALEYIIRVIEFFAQFPLASLETNEWMKVVMGLFYVFVLFKIWKAGNNFLKN